MQEFSLAKATAKWTDIIQIFYNLRRKPTTFDTIWGSFMTSFPSLLINDVNKFAYFLIIVQNFYSLLFIHSLRVLSWGLSVFFFLFFPFLLLSCSLCSHEEKDKCALYFVKKDLVKKQQLYNKIKKPVTFPLRDGDMTASPFRVRECFLRWAKASNKQHEML